MNFPQLSLPMPMLLQLPNHIAVLPFNLTFKPDITLNSFDSLVLKTIYISYRLLFEGNKLWPFHLVIHQDPQPHIRQLTSILALIYNFQSNLENLSHDVGTYSEEFLIIDDFLIHLNKASDPLSKFFLALADTFRFTQFVHNLLTAVNTLNLILSNRIVVSDLTFSAIISFMSDYDLLKFEAILACPIVGVDVFTMFHALLRIVSVT